MVEIQDTCSNYECGVCPMPLHKVVQKARKESMSS